MISEERVNALINKLIDAGLLVILDELTPAERAFFDVYGRKPRKGSSRDAALMSELFAKKEGATV